MIKCGRFTRKNGTGASCPVSVFSTFLTQLDVLRCSECIWRGKVRQQYHYLESGRVGQKSILPRGASDLDAKASAGLLRQCWEPKTEVFYDKLLELVIQSDQLCTQTLDNDRLWHPPPWFGTVKIVALHDGRVRAWNVSTVQPTGMPSNGTPISEQASMSLKVANGILGACYSYEVTDKKAAWSFCNVEFSSRASMQTEVSMLVPKLGCRIICRSCTSVPSLFGGSQGSLLFKRHFMARVQLRSRCKLFGEARVI